LFCCQIPASKRSSFSDNSGRLHKKKTTGDPPAQGRVGRPPKPKAAPGKVITEIQNSVEAAGAISSFKRTVSSWLPQLLIRQGEAIGMMASRLLLVSIITSVLSIPLKLASGVVNIFPALKLVHEMTSVSMSHLTGLWNSTNADETGTVQVPVANRSAHVSTRMDLRGCTPSHLQAISDFVDVCHSKAGAGKVTVNEIIKL